MFVWSLFLFFFFQAEDGIRDLTVTGVQTCALPIFRLVAVDLLDRRTRHRAEGRVTRVQMLTETRRVLVRRGGAARAAVLPRSEERRVGKECRSRWWPCD